MHARGQVAHFDIAPEVLDASAGRSRETPLEALLRRVNGIVEPDCGYAASRGAGRLRRPLLRDLAPLHLPGRGRPALVDPLHRHHVLAWQRRLDVDR